MARVSRKSNGRIPRRPSGRLQSATGAPCCCGETLSCSCPSGSAVATTLGTSIRARLSGLSAGPASPNTNLAFFNVSMAGFHDVHPRAITTNWFSNTPNSRPVYSSPATSDAEVRARVQQNLDQCGNAWIVGGTVPPLAGLPDLSTACFTRNNAKCFSIGVGYSSPQYNTFEAVGVYARPAFPGASTITNIKTSYSFGINLSIDGAANTITYSASGSCRLEYTQQFTSPDAGPTTYTQGVLINAIWFDARGTIPVGDVCSTKTIRIPNQAEPGWYQQPTRTYRYTDPVTGSVVAVPIETGGRLPASSGADLIGRYIIGQGGEATITLENCPETCPQCVGAPATVAIVSTCPEIPTLSMTRSTTNPCAYSGGGGGITRSIAYIAGGFGVTPVYRLTLTGSGWTIVAERPCVDGVMGGYAITSTTGTPPCIPTYLEVG